MAMKSHHHSDEIRTKFTTYTKQVLELSSLLYKITVEVVYFPYYVIESSLKLSKHTIIGKNQPNKNYIVLKKYDKSEKN